MKQVRTFAAVTLRGEMKSVLADASRNLFGSLKNVKPVSEENIHLTLKFLGNVDLAGTGEILDALGESLRGLDAFSYEIRGVGAFPAIKRPRTVWAGVHAEKDEFAELHRRVENASLEMGFGRDKKQYHPHLTLGRVKRPGGLESLVEGMEKLADFQFGRDEVSCVRLMMSELTSAGPIYTELGNVSLEI